MEQDGISIYCTCELFHSFIIYLISDTKYLTWKTQIQELIFQRYCKLYKKAFSKDKKHNSKIHLTENNRAKEKGGLKHRMTLAQIIGVWAVPARGRSEWGMLWSYTRLWGAFSGFTYMQGKFTCYCTPWWCRAGLMPWPCLPHASLGHCDPGTILKCRDCNSAWYRQGPYKGGKGFLHSSYRPSYIHKRASQNLAPGLCFSRPQYRKHSRLCVQ